MSLLSPLVWNSPRSLPYLFTTHQFRSLHFSLPISIHHPTTVSLHCSSFAFFNFHLLQLPRQSVHHPSTSLPSIGLDSFLLHIECYTADVHPASADSYSRHGNEYAGSTDECTKFAHVYTDSAYFTGHTHKRDMCTFCIAVGACSYQELKYRALLFHGYCFAHSRQRRW